jgi:peptidoglycan hydrolase CwlO-like protein
MLKIYKRPSESLLALVCKLVLCEVSMVKTLACVLHLVIILMSCASTSLVKNLLENVRSKQENRLSEISEKVLEIDPNFEENLHPEEKIIDTVTRSQETAYIESFHSRGKYEVENVNVTAKGDKRDLTTVNESSQHGDRSIQNEGEITYYYNILFNKLHTSVNFIHIKLPIAKRGK